MLSNSQSHVLRTAADLHVLFFYDKEILGIPDVQSI